LKKQSILIFALIVLLVVSAFTFPAQAKKVKCPNCGGDGKVTSDTCPDCFGSGQKEPNVTKVRLQVGGSPTQTNVSRVFRNNEAVDVYGVATATVNTQKDAYTQSSNRTLIPAHGEVMILISFDLKYEIYYASLMDIALETITCPTCEGSGGGGALVDCQQCGGTGYVEESAIAGGGFDFAGLAVPIAGVAVVGAVVGAGVTLFKKRQLSEEKIRRFTSFEFEKWVLSRLRGTSASVLDSRRGIDGFTGDGTAVVARQQDNVGKVPVDAFLNSIMQAKAKRGVFVAFSFDREASAAVIKGRINYRVDVKLVTVKELMLKREAALL
jgi:hypothetical protein